MNESLPARAVGIPWYGRDEYARVLSVMEDGATLPRSFDLWEGRAEKLFDTCVSAGGHPVRVRIDPETFVAWCDEQAMRPNAAARTRFATAAVRLRSEFERG